MASSSWCPWGQGQRTIPLCSARVFVTLIRESHTSPKCPACGWKLRRLVGWLVVGWFVCPNICLFEYLFDCSMFKCVWVCVCGKKVGAAGISTAMTFKECAPSSDRVRVWESCMLCWDKAHGIEAHTGSEVKGRSRIQATRGKPKRDQTRAKQANSNTLNWNHQAEMRVNAGTCPKFFRFCDIAR
jgi:hypothetical protein